MGGGRWTKAFRRGTRTRLPHHLANIGHAGGNGRKITRGDAI